MKQALFPDKHAHCPFCLCLDNWPERGKKLFKRFRKCYKGDLLREKTDWYMGVETRKICSRIYRYVQDLGKKRRN